VSEIDVTGHVLSTFADVTGPRHLSRDSDDHVFVVDSGNRRILLLNSKLELERVFVDRSSQIKLPMPRRLCYNEMTSQLHVVHSDNHYVSQWSLRWVTDS